MADEAKVEDMVKLLVALQDLDSMVKEARDADTGAKLREMGFSLDGETELQKARQKLAERIKPQLLNRYERVSKSYDRTIVPVAGEMCTGCFAKIPTSFRSLHEKSNILTCESCGRILYFA